MKRKYLDRFQLEDYHLDPTNWGNVYIGNLPHDKKEKFIKRQEAIKLFLLSDMSLKNITIITGISKSEIYRLLTRCLSLKDDGTIYGFAGLLAYSRVKSYEADDYENNYSGSFNKLLRDYPDLKTLLFTEYFSTDKNFVREKKQSVKNIHRKFISRCREIGISEDSYPLNTTSKAFKSIERHLNFLLKSNSSLGAKMNGPNAFMLHKSVNNTTNSYTDLIRPYERVEFDGHMIDAIFSIIIYTPHGDKVIVNLNRLWLLCVIDVTSRAVIGYHISFSNKNYSTAEVLKCFNKALLPWKPKKLSIPGLQYNEGDGFPSFILENTQYALWDEICMDNAKSHLSDKMINHLTELRCAINYGPVANPTGRSIVERFFKTLEYNGFHRIPSTTGSNVLDPKRDKAEEMSIIYEITVDQLEEVMDVVIANYNNTSHSAHLGLTPLNIIKQRLERGMHIRKLPTYMQNNLNLFPSKKTTEVKGDISKGRTPYVYFEYSRYTSIKLINDSSKIGERLTLFIDEENIQTIQAYNEDGTYYDTLTASGKWSRMPHSLIMRKLIMKHRNIEEFNYLDHQDPIAAYQEFLKTKSISDKQARRKLQEIERYKKEHNIKVQLEKKSIENQKIVVSQEKLHSKIIKQKQSSKITDEVQMNLENNVIDTTQIKISDRHKKIIEESKVKKGKSITF